MKAVKPPVRSCSSRRWRRGSTRSSSVSTWPNIMVAVVFIPSRCAVSITSSHCAVVPLAMPMMPRTRSERISAPPAGDRVEPGRNQPPERLLDAEARGAGDVLDLRRREPVDPDRIGVLDPAEERLVVLDAEGWGGPALDRDLP